MGQFYLYRHIRNDLNVPFYIGIGTKQKSFAQPKTEYRRAFTTTFKRSDIWEKTFNKTNQDITIEVLYESDSFDEIKNKEKEFISLYGRKNISNGPLVNLTDGGDGSFGFKHTEETLIKLRDNPERIENLKRMQASKKGIPRPESVRKTISEKLKGVPMSEERKRNMTLGRLGMKQTEIHNRNISLGLSWKKIGKFNDNLELIGTYIGYKYAAQSVENGKRSNIQACVEGRRKKHRGFIWKEL